MQAHTAKRDEREEFINFHARTTTNKKKKFREIIT
jgi:hypothetical protein